MPVHRAKRAIPDGWPESKRPEFYFGLIERVVARRGATAFLSGFVLGMMSLAFGLGWLAMMLKAR